MIPRSKAEKFAATDKKKISAQKRPYCNSAPMFVCVNQRNANGIVVSNVLISLDFKGLSQLK